MVSATTPKINDNLYKTINSAGLEKKKSRDFTSIHHFGFADTGFGDTHFAT